MWDVLSWKKIRVHPCDPWHLCSIVFDGSVLLRLVVVCGL